MSNKYLRTIINYYLPTFLPQGVQINQKNVMKVISNYNSDKDSLKYGEKSYTHAYSNGLNKEPKLQETKQTVIEYSKHKIKNVSDENRILEDKNQYICETQIKNTEQQKRLVKRKRGEEDKRDVQIRIKEFLEICNDNGDTQTTIKKMVYKNPDTDPFNQKRYMNKYKKLKKKIIEQLLSVYAETEQDSEEMWERLLHNFDKIDRKDMAHYLLISELKLEETLSIKPADPIIKDLQKVVYPGNKYTYIYENEGPKKDSWSYYRDNIEESQFADKNQEQRLVKMLPEPYGTAYQRVLDLKMPIMRKLYQELMEITKTYKDDTIKASKALAYYHRQYQPKDPITHQDLMHLNKPLFDEAMCNLKKANGKRRLGADSRLITKPQALYSLMVGKMDPTDLALIVNSNRLKGAIRILQCNNMIRKIWVPQYK